MTFFIKSVKVIKVKQGKEGINLFKKKISAIITVISIMSIGAPTAVYSSTVGDNVAKVVDVEAVTQEKTNWCWAASTKCISDYLGGKGLSQSAIVKSVKGSIVDKGASDAEIQEALENDGINTTYKHGKLSYSRLRTDIINDKPIEAVISWKKGGAHAIVLYGYSGRTTDSTNLVYYMNPGKDSTKFNIQEYNSFCDNNKFSWRSSFYDNTAE